MQRANYRGHVAARLLRDSLSRLNVPAQRSAARACTLESIPVELALQALPRFDEEPVERYPYGARSEAAIYVGDLLHQMVPALQGDEPSMEIVAIARRPGVLSKVSLRPAPTRVSRVTAGIGADHLARVSARLDGERIQVVRWQRSAVPYIADALGLGEVPSIVLLPSLGHARVLLGDIDMRGMAGWRGLNVILASALTGWRIRLEPVAATAAWARLQSAMRSHRPVVANVVGRTERGLRVEVSGLYAVVSGFRGDAPVGLELEVRIRRMDPDEGRIFVSARPTPDGQLPLL